MSEESLACPYLSPPIAQPKEHLLLPIARLPVSCPCVLLSFADFESGLQDSSRKIGQADGQKIEAPQTISVGFELILLLASM